MRSQNWANSPTGRTEREGRRLGGMSIPSPSLTRLRRPGTVIGALLTFSHPIVAGIQWVWEIEEVRTQMSEFWQSAIGLWGPSLLGVALLVWAIRNPRRRWVEHFPNQASMEGKHSAKHELEYLVRNRAWVIWPAGHIVPVLSEKQLFGRAR